MTPHIDPHTLLAGITDALRDWLPEQRWFAGKGRELLRVHPVRAVELPGAHDTTHGTRAGRIQDEPLLVHAVVEAEQSGSIEDRYQLLLGVRSELPEQLAHGWICGWHELAVYEAAIDSELTGRLLRLLANGTTIDGLRFGTEPGVTLAEDLRGRPVGAEQSNTSLVFGQQYILKIFRRLELGESPDLELHRALHQVGCTHIAALLGAIEGELDAKPVTFGMMQEFLANSVDGWAMATASVRDLMAEADLHAYEVGGDFASESHRLGEAVASVHADLAHALGHSRAGTDDLNAAVDAMHQHLDTVLRSVPELAAQETALRAVFERARATTGEVRLQRIHGDLHLGQLLRTVSGWTLIDFEGAPAVTLDERVALRSPLRDVASMLRSFDYAAHQLLVGAPEDNQLAHRALEWAQRNRAAFCAGYAEVAGPEGDPRNHPELLHALELDKAVYEVRYEHGNRPDWLPIPLASISRITEGG